MQTDERSNVASVFVQADDFSGAAEVGYCFGAHGFPAQVLLGTPTALGADDADTSFTLSASRAGCPRRTPRRGWWTPSPGRGPQARR